MQIDKRFSRFLLYLFLSFTLTGSALNYQIPSGVVESFGKGNSRDLSKHFNNSVELVVPGNEDVYSKSQAELILRNFFSANRPVRFEILHQGGKELSRYAIGNLVTQKGEFRIYILLKLKNDDLLIHLLRIERVEDNY